MLCGVGLQFNLVRDELLEGVSDKCGPEAAAAGEPGPGSSGGEVNPISNQGTSAFAASFEG